MDLTEKLGNLRKTIEVARAASPLAPPQITLLAASKSQPIQSIKEAYTGNIRHFGENKVQEAEEKWGGLRAACPDITLHLIGPLQTNKVKQALGLFDVIQTLDRPKLADEISKVMSGASPFATRHFYIQVNTGKEPQKAGVMPDEADGFIAYCRKLSLPVVGLMCVPPADQPPAPHFALLRAIAQRNGLSELSMGMSDDYEVAIRMGSTCVRLGRALFGERSY